MFTAKKALNILSEDKFDDAKTQKQRKSFEDTADGLITYAKSPSVEMRMMWTMPKHQIEVSRVAAKKRLRAVRENSKGDSASGEGSASYMVDAYNQTSNQTH
ncbi:hypothetical protein G7047_14165 [Diaphorobacter sp. HDW4A]|nr:hypothetical protein [Diaphorobacter sp. HDW4A]QIL80917.1 hypothetical protein G7047_14165 [Diaphorobacter sp. HDW4A]